MRPLGKTGNYISTRIGRAIADYNLIEDGDKILVAVSGGKDSLGLLKLLNERRKWAPINYSLAACHVESDYKCSNHLPVKRLKKIFDCTDIPYHIERMKVVEKGRSLTCFWCSWNRRKTLFTIAGRLGCNKVALGHHKDDIVETLLLNIFYHGEHSAMNPRQELFGGKIVIIRPLAYVEEKYLKRFAKESGFPKPSARCPNSDTSKRRLMKEFVKRVERECAYAKTNIFRSMVRVKDEYLQVKCEGVDSLEDAVSAIK